MNRTARAALANDTLRICFEGRYTAPTGSDVSIRDDLQAAIDGTALYRPSEFRAVFRQRDAILAGRPRFATAMEVRPVTTLAAGRALLAEESEADVLALNFASAKNPGGGFLGGAQAQEESLARASGLYPCLQPQQEYYESNRRHGSALYTDHMIHAPRVPVFRDDDGTLLAEPYLLSFLTAPAVNAGAVRHAERSLIEPVMRERTEKVLSVAVIHGHEILVLGAWGCGVFRQDPHEVARWFHEQLVESDTFRGAFRRVVFAVPDFRGSDQNLDAFRRQFGQ
jgi:uncharacterized protein (TIGR02452 family)